MIMVIKKNISQPAQWIFNDGSQPFQLKVVHAHEINDQEHFHQTMHEYFYVLCGSMTIAINGDVIRLYTDDLVVVEPGEPHYIKEKSPDLRLFLVMPPPRPNDKVILKR